MVMAILNIAFLLVIGLLGLMASGGLPGGNAQLRESAGRAAAQIAPFAGIIGIVSLAWGLWGLISFVSNMGLLFRFAPLAAIIGLITIIVLIGLGLILAYPLLAQALAGSGGGKDALDRSLASVKPFQRPLALAAIILAVVNLVLLILASANVMI